MVSTLRANLSMGSSCPICNPISGRTAIVMQIVSFLRQSGSFSVQSVSQFWQLFGENLCYQCKSDLDSITDRRQQALELLEEAVRLDASNDVARKNLQFLRGIV